jgi:hypothetical protein
MDIMMENGNSTNVLIIAGHGIIVIIDEKKYISKNSMNQNAFRTWKIVARYGTSDYSLHWF